MDCSVGASRQVSFLVVALLLCQVPLRVDGATKYAIYQQDTVDSLQALWGEWNKSTPNSASNLAGWSSTQPYPCNQKFTNKAPNWRGVECFSDVAACRAGTNNCSYFVIGLTLNNASITGALPPAIGNITTLTTLELTGNPDLQGPLPQEIGNIFLYNLNLRDNAFSGKLPDLTNAFTLLTIDLSGNGFNGTFPLPQIRELYSLQTLKLARNSFVGGIPQQAFENMTQLADLDLSANEFTGALPNLTMCKYLQSLDVSNNTFNGSLPDLTMLTSLNTVNLSNNNFTGNFSLSSVVDTSVNSAISALDLSGNQLTGSVSLWDGSDLGPLNELYLDDNHINGTLNITQLLARGLVQRNSGNASEGLRTVSLTNNSISNVIYPEGNIAGISTVFRLQGNPYCQGDSNDGTRCFCQQLCFDSQGALKSNNRKIIIIATVVSSISALAIVMLVVAAVLYRTRRYHRYLLLQVRQKFEEFDVKPTIFSYNELRAATRDFHPDMKLGEGGYGAVYKGNLPNGTVVAVKQLFIKTSEAIDDFLNEVVLITGMKHRNLVNLKGCCLHGHQRLLVYEYVDNYDIDQILLRDEFKTLMSWAARQNICLGVARGLHYLHELAQPRIIHRDIKAANILLDKNFEPKIADFGLALLFPDEQSHIMTVHVAGTKGYLAPEYASLGQLSEKVDVFSFGVLCLEVVSGRRNIDELKLGDEAYLSKWAWKLHREGNLMDLVDPKLNLRDDERLEVQRLINIALLCVQNTAEQRPTMARVVAMLQNDSESEVLVLNSGDEEQSLDTVRLLAFGKSGLATVKEDGESSFMDSARRAESIRREGGDLTISKSLIQRSEIRAR
ncbi:hypothetical protein M758_11G071100 [Ceratodon purpureus]|uniref:Protein kinase domain-containing protein n=1 Tax=Ceratodon purpureus TaxID=3225 RepID=A0A8T0GDB2_CERPU|nr:hypothetical protein M758_N026200 [Ceratodon purpureus]KAG0556705.1 hypothetical protein KC19_11G073300 [Ceratodon purpureus]KAG0600922.1 hypothetical protein M758_11G071100 [Ceratodon purpureus]